VGHPSDGDRRYSVHHLRKNRIASRDRVQDKGMRTRRLSLLLPPAPAQGLIPAKPYFGGGYNHVAGKIKETSGKKKTLYTISGKWDDEIFIKAHDTKARSQCQALFMLMLIYAVIVHSNADGRNALGSQKRTSQSHHGYQTFGPAG